MASYLQASHEPLRAHSVAAFLRNTAAQAVKSIIPESYEVKGSPGKGNWNKAPWIGIFNPLVTDSAQRGYYLVYLFREDLTGCYLSLNQGVTDVRASYKGAASAALKARALNYRAMLGSLPTRWNTESIDLRTTARNTLAADYEVGNVASVFYPCNNDTLSDRLLARDLQDALQVYDDLLRQIELGAREEPPEEDELGNTFIEDYASFRTHKRIERNQRLAAAVKQIQGYVCMVCGFDSLTRYPGIGAKYIEAHHLQPVSQLKGRTISRDPQRDFAVLCANCHRMIHRSADPSDVAALRKAMNLE